MCCRAVESERERVSVPAASGVNDVLPSPAVEPYREEPRPGASELEERERVCAAAQLAATNVSSLFTSFPAKILAGVYARVRDVVNEPLVNCACS